MKSLQVALYARVSSEQQAEAKTIESQLAEMRTRMVTDGFELAHILEFIDEGYSGSTLVRPSLERLRDVAAAGGLDRLYVHCPDRFARNYAYQVLLLDELTQQGVEVIFLNRPLGQTPEDQLLLQVQGVIAEYERAKFLERSRRGKRHAAQEGRVGILCHAPYGYRYINKQEGAGTARFEIVFEEARKVQQIFGWVGQERCTISEVCRRLQQAGVHTQTGKAYWNHKTIWDMLKNPAYKGEAAFGKTRSGPLEPRLRAPKGRPSQSKRGYSPKNVPQEEWITIAIPALIDAAVFEAAQQQLQENKRRARIPEKGTRYLLQGLLLCAQCGYAYCGRTNDARNAYYRCSGSDASRFGGTRLCHNKEVRIDRLDATVWQEVCQLLEEPQRLEQEYRRRLEPPQQQGEQEGLATQMSKLRRGIARLIDSYAEGLIDKTEFEPRVARMRERVQHLEEQIQHLKEQTEVEEEVRLILGHLETFSTKVQAGLQNADWQTRRDIIRALVKRVEIDEQQIRVVFRVSPTMLPSSSQTASHNWQHCGRREHASTFHCNMGTAMLLEPIAQAHQVRGHGAKGLPFLAGLSVLWKEQASNHRFLVNIQTRTSFVDNLHRLPPHGSMKETRTKCRQATGYQAGGNSPLRASLDESEQQTLMLQGIQVILLVRLVALVSYRPSALGLPHSSISFFMDSGARQRMNYCWETHLASLA